MSAAESRWFPDEQQVVAKPPAAQRQKSAAPIKPETNCVLASAFERIRVLDAQSHDG
jgi:hypothetical protein